MTPQEFKAVTENLKSSNFYLCKEKCKEKAPERRQPL